MRILYRQCSPIGLPNSSHFAQETLNRQLNKPEDAESNFMEAQNLWMRGDQTRLHPYYAGCVYMTAVVCLRQGKVEAACKSVLFSLHSLLPFNFITANVFTR